MAPASNADNYNKELIIPAIFPVSSIITFVYDLYFALSLLVLLVAFTGVVHASRVVQFW